jgi:hypothetical protein
LRRATDCRTAALRALPLLGLLLCGCGLADYEAQMKDTQARLQEHDRTNKLLDEPVVLPRVNLFIRPPRGIQKTAEGEPRDGLLYRYPARPGGAGPFLFVEVAVAADRPDFVAEVLRHYPASGQALAFPPGHARPPEHRTPLKFDTHEFDGDEATYSVNVYQGATARVAVTFGIAKGQRAAADAALNRSLESLGLGEEADRLRREHLTPPWRLTEVPSR